MYNKKVQSIGWVNEDKKLNTGEGTLQFTKYSWILFKYEWNPFRKCNHYHANHWHFLQ